MLKILQARRQQYMNCELLILEVDLEKAGEPEITAKIHWIIEKAKEFHKNIYFCFIDSTKAFDYMDHNTLQKIFQEMGIPEHHTCFLRNL